MKMRNKKWKLTMIVIGILVGVAVAFILRGWKEPGLWIPWFTALPAAVGIFTGGNYLEKKQYILNGLEKKDKQ